jgi:hypothetical protein
VNDEYPWCVLKISDRHSAEQFPRTRSLNFGTAITSDEARKQYSTMKAMPQCQHLRLFCCGLHQNNNKNGASTMFFVCILLVIIHLMSHVRYLIFRDHDVSGGQ